MSIATTTKPMPKTQIQPSMPRMWKRKGKAVIQERIVSLVQILQGNLQKVEAIASLQLREFPDKIQRKSNQ